MTVLGSIRPGNVPTDRVGPIIDALIRDRWPDGSGIEVLAEKVGCSYDAIDGVIRKQNPGCEFDLADRLLCALGRPDIWRGQLLDLYEVQGFVQTCVVPSCGKTFPETKVGRRQRYCSSRCRNLANEVRRGNATGERLRKKNKCLKGHSLTPDNVKANKRGERQCRTCQRDYQREWARIRRATDPRFVERKRAAHRQWKAKPLEVAA